MNQTPSFQVSRDVENALMQAIVEQLGVFGRDGKPLRLRPAGSSIEGPAGARILQTAWSVCPGFGPVSTGFESTARVSWRTLRCFRIPHDDVRPLHGVDLLYSAGAHPHSDRSVLLERPVEGVVVVADRRDHAEHQRRRSGRSPSAHRQSPRAAQTRRVELATPLAARVRAGVLGAGSALNPPS